MRILLLIAACYFFQSSSVAACTCEQINLTTAIKASKYVFRASINGAIVTNPTATTIRTRIFFNNLIPIKGGVPPFTELYTIDSGSCGMDILVPSAYWIFTDSEGLVDRCSFSQLARNEEVRPLEMEAYEQILQNVSKKTVETMGVEIADVRGTALRLSVFTFVGLVSGLLLGRWIGNRSNGK